jgi:hypothetical protein
MTTINETFRSFGPVLAAMKKIPDLALVVPRVWGNRLSLER